MRRCNSPLPAIAALGVAFVLLWSPRPAAAQEIDTTETDVPADSQRVVALPALVVEALRTPLEQRDVPFAVTIRDLDTPLSGVGLSLDDELGDVPGLQIDDRHNDALGDRIVIRGFGARAQFGVRGVQVAVDGIPATLPDGQTTLNHVDLATLRRAEVVRGPTAVVYGNAAGGVILLETAPPPAAKFQQRLRLTAGSDRLLRFTSVTGNGDQDSGWRVALTRETLDGFREHSDADNVKVTGRADASVAGGRLRVVGHAVSYDARNPGSLTRDQYDADPGQAQPFNVVQQTGEDGRQAQLGIGWERVWRSVRIDASLYGIVRSIENPIPPTIIELDRWAGGLQALLQSTRDTADAAWTLGIEAGVQRDDRLNFINNEGRAGRLTLDQLEQVREAAGFAQVALPLGANFRWFVGARYDRIRFSADDDHVTADNPDDSGTRTLVAFSPSTGLSFSPTRSVSVFANVSTAFQTPTTTELVNRPGGAGGFNSDLEPQRTVSIEAGARTRFGGRVDLEIAAYRARVRDALVPFEVESAPGRPFFRNAAGAQHRGIEIAADANVAGIDLRAAYSRTDARFTAFSTAERTFDGHRVPGVRPWALDISLRTQPVSSLHIGLEHRRTGDMPVDDANDAVAAGYAVTHLRAALSPQRIGAFVAEPFAGIDNVFDTKYVASVVPNAFGARFFEPGPGRTIFIGARATLTLDP